jgi:hypothetical protein
MIVELAQKLLNAFHIEGLLADGEPVPEPSTRAVQMPIYA